MAMNSKRKQRKKQKLVKMYGDCCCWCGQKLSWKQMTIEHIKHKSKGGGNDIGNLRIACSPCNNSRGNRLYPPGFLPVEWRFIE
ncbi:HNH endonuclease [Pantanalinema sp. GBBB05]|uniref:HNH endonuclease n=1 Tax=Pantanalinema sp. GBBB05 TaxID=2604139 RepID=UPI001D1BCE8A|nr:HNH endonuclease [Pantanalinema sp. GBBB05]